LFQILYLTAFLPFGLVNRRMVVNDQSATSKGGGFRLLFNGLTANYYTGRYNGCYKTMWFRFGEWCSAQEEFWYAPGNCNFTAGRAPDDGWFEGDLRQVGPAPPTAPHPTQAPVPTPPVTPAPVRVVQTQKPVPTVHAPVRVGPTNRPVLTSAPARSVAPTGRPSAAMMMTPPTDEADPLAISPTQEPIASSSPSAVPSAAAVPAPSSSSQTAKPVLCHFRYC
jgi:hypothetical protein